MLFGFIPKYKDVPKHSVIFFINNHMNKVRQWKRRMIWIWIANAVRLIFTVRIRSILNLLRSINHNCDYFFKCLSRYPNKQYMSRPARKPTLWTLRKSLTRISLSMPHRLTRIDTFRLKWIFCFRNHYSIPLSPWYGMCWPGSVCAGWSGSIHSAEVIMLVFSQDGSYVFALLGFYSVFKTISVISPATVHLFMIPG